MKNLEYISLFRDEHEKNQRARNNMLIYCSLLWAGMILFFVFITYIEVSELELTLRLFIGGAAFGMLIAFFGSLSYVIKVQNRFHPHGKLIYALSQVYQNTEKMGGKGPLVESKKREAIRELVKGINYVRTTVENSESVVSKDLFLNKELSLWGRTQKSLQYQIYPKLKKRKSINQVRKRLVPIMKSLIDNNLDEYEVALTKIEKLPKEKMEIPEMKTYTDKASELYHSLHSSWMRRPILRFLSFCGGIGVIFYFASYFIEELPASGALLATITAAAILTSLYKS